MASRSAAPSPAKVASDGTLFAATFLKILDKNERLIRLVHNPVQVDYLGKLTPRDLVLKARQMGFSTIIQGEFFRFETTGTARTTTLAHDNVTTQKLRRMKDRFWKNLPENFRPKRHYANATVTTYPGFDSEATVVTAGSVNIGRGGTSSHIHGSEVAFWKDAQAIMAGIMQGGNPQWIVLESTPNGAQGWFYERCMEAMDGNRTWRLHFYPWFADSSYRMALDPGEVLTLSDDELALVEAHGLSLEQIKWRRTKQGELKHQFLQEYPEDPKTCFLLSGEGYFGDITPAYRAPKGATWQEGHRYVAGLDFGQTVDYTVLCIIDMTTMEQVELLRIHRLPWAEMRRRVIDRLTYWHVKTVVAEENSMGGTNIEEMTDELRTAQAGKVEPRTAIRRFKTTNASKAQIMGALHEALHSGSLALLDTLEQRREMQAFQARQTQSGAWQYSAPDGEHDDIVIANALAWSAASAPPPAQPIILKRGRE